MTRSVSYVDIYKACDEWIRGEYASEHGQKDPHSINKLPIGEISRDFPLAAIYHVAQTSGYKDGHGLDYVARQIAGLTNESRPYELATYLNSTLSVNIPLEGNSAEDHINDIRRLLEPEPLRATFGALVDKMAEIIRSTGCEVNTPAWAGQHLRPSGNTTERK